MEGQNQNQNETVNTADKLKKEAVDTAKEVKEAVNNTDIKQDVNKTNGFLSGLFKNPIKEIETVANSSKNEFLKIAMIIFVVWLVAIFINSVIDVFQSYSLVSNMYTNFGTFFRTSVRNVSSVIKSVITPIISLAVLSGIVYIMQKGNNKKSFIQTLSAIIIAKIPVVAAIIVGLLGNINQFYKLTNQFSGFCNIISTILVYFTVKALYGQTDDNSFIKKFAIIIGIFYIARFILTFLGLYI